MLPLSLLLCREGDGTCRAESIPGLQETETSLVQTPPPSRKLHGTSQPLCQVFKISSCPKRNTKAPRWLLSEQLPTHCCEQGLPLLPMEAKRNTADQVAGTSSWRTCQRRLHLLLGSWKINPPGFPAQMWCRPLVLMLAGAENVRGPCVP